MDPTTTQLGHALRNFVKGKAQERSLPNPDSTIDLKSRRDQVIKLKLPQNSAKNNDFFRPSGSADFHNGYQHTGATASHDAALGNLGDEEISSNFDQTISDVSTEKGDRYGSGGHQTNHGTGYREDFNPFTTSAKADLHRSPHQASQPLDTDNDHPNFQTTIRQRDYDANTHPRNDQPPPTNTCTRSHPVTSTGSRFAGQAAAAAALINKRAHGDMTSQYDDQGFSSQASSSNGGSGSDGRYLNEARTASASGNSQELAVKLDYSPAELQTMPYAALVAQAFDDVPAAARSPSGEHTRPGLPVDEQHEDSLEGQLELFLHRPEEAQRVFFRGLDGEAWGRAGDWITRRMAGVDAALRAARRERREAARGFEETLAGRQAEVGARLRANREALDRVKAGAVALFGEGTGA